MPAFTVDDIFSDTHLQEIDEDSILHARKQQEDYAPAPPKLPQPPAPTSPSGGMSIEEVFSMDQLDIQDDSDADLNAVLENAGKQLKGGARALRGAGGRFLGGGASSLLNAAAAVKGTVGDITMAGLDLAVPGDLTGELAKQGKTAQFSQDLQDDIHERFGPAASYFAGLFLPTTEREQFGIDQLDKQIDQWTAEHGQMSKTATKALERGEWWNPAVLTERGLDIGSNLLLYIGANMAVPGAGLALAGAMEGGGARKEAMDRMRAKAEEQGLDFDQERARIIADGTFMLVGATAAIAEKLPLEFLTNKVSNRIVGQTARRLFDWGGDMAAEGVEEMITGLVTDTARYVLEEDPDAYEGFVANRLSEFASGAAGAGMAKVGIGRASAVAQRIAQVGKTEGGRARLQELADNPNPSRADLKRAGLDVKTKLNEVDRKVIARAADPEEFASVRHQVEKLAGRSQQTELKTEYDASLALGLAAKAAQPGGEAAARGLQSMGVTRDDALDMIKQQWLAEDARRPGRLGGRPPQLPIPKTDLQAELQPVREAKRQKDVKSRDQRLAQLEKNVTKLQKKKKRYSALAAEARQAGDEVAADAYQRFVVEAQQDITRQLTANQRAESPVSDNPIMTDERVAALNTFQQAWKKYSDNADSLRETEIDDAVKEKDATEEKLSTEDPGEEEVSGEMEPQRIPPKSTVPEILSGETGTATPGTIFAPGAVEKAVAKIGEVWDSRPVKFMRAKTIGTGDATEATVTTLDKKRQRRISKRQLELSQALVDYKDAAKAEAGVSDDQGVPDRLAHLADQYLKGNVKLADLPEQMQVPTKRLREKIDEWSKEALDSGAITGPYLADLQARSKFFDDLRAHAKTGMIHEDLVNWIIDEGEFAGTPISPEMAGTVASILRNDGLYLTRSYDAFQDPRWRERMPDQVRDDMAALLTRENEARIARITKINQHRAKQNRPLLDVPAKLTPDQIETRMNEILDEALDAQEMKTFLSGKLGKQDRTSLKARKDLPPEYRAFLGEVKDPVENVIKTGMKLAQLVEQYKFIEQVRDNGMGVFLWEKDDPNRPTNASVQITSDKDPAMRPVEGLWTTRDTRGLFQRDPKTIGWISKLWNFSEGLAKKSKTAYSLQAQIRQWVGNPAMSVSNGNWPFYLSRPKAWWTAITGRGSEEQRAYYNDATLYGLVEEGIDYQLMHRLANKSGNEIEQMLNDFEKGGKSWLDSATTGLPAKALRGGKKLFGIAEKQYGYTDSAFKLWSWEAEKAKYWDVLTERGMTPEEIKQHTADIVRRTNPTYSELAPIVQTIRDIPGVGFFMAFPAAQVQNAHNRLVQTVNELKDPDTRVKMIGMKRLAGQMAVYSVPWIAEAASAGWVGMDDEEMKAFKETLPPWAKYAPLMFLGRDDDGKVRYLNLGYVDPMAYFTAPVKHLLDSGIEMLKGESGDSKMEMAADAVTEAIGMIADPFYSETGTATAIFNIKRNVDEFGNPIWVEDDTLAFKVAAAGKEAYEKIVEPGTLRSAQRIYYGLSDITSPGGKKFNPVTELTSVVTGFKIEDFDLKQSFSWTANNFAKDLQNANNVAWRLAGEGNVTSEAGKVDRAKHLHEAAIMEMHEAYENHHKAFPDIDEATLREELGTSSRMSDDIINQVYTGEVKPFIPSQMKTLERFINNTQDEEYKAQLTQAREEKIDDSAWQVGADQTSARNRGRIRTARKSLDESGITPSRAMNGVISRAARDTIDRQVSKWQKDFGDKYDTEYLQGAAVAMFRKQGMPMTNAVKNRVSRVAKAYGVPVEELRTFFGENSKRSMLDIPTIGE